MLDCFDQLATQMVTLIANSASSPKKCPAGGHNSESKTATWWVCVVQDQVRPPLHMSCLVPGNINAGTASYSRWRGILLQFHGSMGSFRKSPNTFCLCFQNIDGLSQTANVNGKLKLHALLQFINAHQIDLFAAAELNTCWDLVSPAQRLLLKTKGW